MRFCQHNSKLTLTAPLIALLSLFALLWTGYRLTRISKMGDYFATALLCSVLVSYHMNLYDLSLLVLPVILLQTREALL